MCDLMIQRNLNSRYLSISECDNRDIKTYITCAKIDRGSLKR